MTPTPISEATILHFCRLFMLNIPVNSTSIKISQGALQNSYFILKLFEVKQCSNRIILVRIPVGQQVFGLLSVYVPQGCLKDAVKDLFYDQLRSIPASTSLIPYDDCYDRGVSTGSCYKEVHGG